MSESAFPELALPKNPYGVETPLRYPGGKSSMAGFLANIIESSNGAIRTYIEPFAGGAGAGVALLSNGVVDSAVINDYDPAVWCFWKAVTEQNERFLETMEKTPITMDEWYHQREVYRRRDLRGKFRLGFAFFFLNRCNRSGIVKGGVIGGYDQTGAYKIDARFKKDKLAEKIKRIGSLSDKIEVLNLDGTEAFERFSGDSSALFYLDPPYIGQGESLYLNALNRADHIELATCVQRHSDSNWIVTYDYDELVHSEECYGKDNAFWYTLTYSAQKKRRERELLICSDSLRDSVEQYVVKPQATELLNIKLAKDGNQALSQLHRAS